MGKFFSLDSTFIKVMTRVADIVILNLFVLLSCFGVVTIGPALVALFYVTLKMVRDEEAGIAKSFFKSFIQNFLQGVVVLIVLGLLVAFFSYDIYIAYKWAEVEGTTASKLILAALCGITFMVGSGFIYAFPVVAKFYNSTFRVIKNSIVMAVANLPQTLLMWVVTAAFVALVVINPYALMFAFGAWAYVISLVMVKVFDKYIPKEEEPEADEEISEDIVDEEEMTHIRMTIENMEGNTQDTVEDNIEE